jgi:S-adenosylhomocysteine hydrolase
MPRRLVLLATLLAASGLADARRPPKLEGASLEAAKQDWRKVSAGQLGVEAFKGKYGLTNGSMTRLRKAYPQDFGKLDRQRVFGAAELRTMAANWKRVAAGELTLTEFKAAHGLSTETYDRLRSEHASRFPEVELKLGGSRLAEGRRAARLDPSRLSALAAAWQSEVLGGKSSIDAFYAKHGTSKRELTALRKLPEWAEKFASATGIASAQRKNTIDAGRVSELSRLWQREVVTGKTTIAEFRASQKLPQRIYRELRAEHADAFPEPAVVKHEGGPARRSFSATELALIKADWQKVLSLELPRAEFLQKHGLHSAMMKRLRDENPGAFPELGAKSRKTAFAGGKLEAMKADWLSVVAGQSSEAAFRQKHGLSLTLFKRLRNEPELAAHFPKLKGATKAEVATASAAVVSDWSAVRAGGLSAKSFRERHPQVSAKDLLALQLAAKSAPTRLGAIAAELGLGKKTITEAQAKKVKAEWGRVLRRELTQGALLAELGIAEHHFRAYKSAHADLFPAPEPKPAPAPKGRAPSKYASRTLYTPAQLEAAKVLFAGHQRGQLEKRDLVSELRKLGVSASGQGLDYLRGLDPAAFASRDEFLATNHGAIIADLSRLAVEHQHVIRKWSDLREVVARDAGFTTKYGKLNLAVEGSILKRDRDGDRRLYAVMEQIGTQAGKPSGAAGSRGRGPAERPRTTSSGAARERRDTTRASANPRRESARALAAALRGLEPSEANLAKVVSRLGKDDPNFGTRKKWLSLRSEFEGVFPELRRWNFDSHRPYSLRYVARWTEAAHQAGPGASYEQIAAIFKRSPEYAEDKRLPPKKLGTSVMASSYPELVASWANRRTFQKTRALLELLRTAPAGTTLYGLKKQLAALKMPYSYAHKWLSGLTPADAERFGMSRATFAELKGAGFRGLGQARNAGFDPTEEPPEVKMALVRDILDTPTMPKMLELAISKLDGRRPFESHNVMFINHRYSDIVSLVDAMARAGMARETAVFVSTPYPFKDAVSYQLEKRGLTTIVPEQNMKSYAAGVEKGIRKMLAQHQAEVAKWGKGKPILIMDDGGMASKLIATKFKEHIGKFRIVEVTAAGYRLAQEFQRSEKRLPFVYYSIAYTDLKKKVTSSFFGRRVAQRVLNLLPQTGVALANKKVAILGGGPMGLFAGLELRGKGYDVTFVDPNAAVAATLRGMKFRVAPLEQALPGRGMILGMSGYQTLRAEHLALIDSGAVIAQGSSKRNEFEMDAFEKRATSKVELPRTDGLAQKSFTYSFKGGKQLHFFGDGWTINHDGSLHGTPMKDIQLELAIYFESAVQAASTPLGATGVFREIGKEAQQSYFDAWRRLRK